MSKITLKEFLVADAILGDSVTNENGLNSQAKWTSTHVIVETMPIEAALKKDKL